MALVPATAAQAKKVPKGFFGIAQGGSVDAKDYKLMHKTHVQSYRLSIYWRAVEPRKGTFNWTPIDDRIGGLASNGITPVLMIWGSPQWATGSGNPGVPPLKGKASLAWKSFLRAVVNRYGKGGRYWKDHPAVDRKPVKSLQIWNEPNLPKYFAKPTTGTAKSVPKAGKTYGKFVKASDKAIHKADKHAKLILAGLSGNPKRSKLEPDKFIKKVLKVRKIKKHFDAAALHPYAPKIGRLKSRVSSFRRAMKKGGAKKKEIWLTEIGWGSDKGGQRLNKGVAGQAKLLKKSFKTTLKKRKQWNLGSVYWFDWRDPPQNAPVGCSFCPSAGLLKNDRTRKTSYRKFKHFAKLQGGGHHHHHHHHHHSR